MSLRPLKSHRITAHKKSWFAQFSCDDVKLWFYYKYHKWDQPQTFCVITQRVELQQDVLLVYPSVVHAHKQTTRFYLEAIVQPVGLSWPLAVRTKPLWPSPHPHASHRWNAAPGILPEFTGPLAAAAWNTIRPLSKHAFHYGCVLHCHWQRKHLKLVKCPPLAQNSSPFIDLLHLMILIMIYYFCAHSCCAVILNFKLQILLWMLGDVPDLEAFIARA